MNALIERSHLIILQEVERCGSVTAAAERLALSQSALSHAIRKLEGQLGVEVWQKEGRRLRFTPAGEYLLSVARRLLPQLEHAETIVRQLGTGQRGSLSLGVECHPCQTWLLRVIGPFLERFPKVDVDIKQRFQFGGIGALLGHEIDILATPDPLQKPELEFFPVLNYEQVLVVSASSPLADSDCVTPKAVAEQTLITYPVEQDRLDIFTQFLLPANCRPRRHKHLEDTAVMLQMVAAGRGVAALPDWLVKEYQPRFAIRGLKLGTTGVHKQLFLGVRESSLLLPFVEGFLELGRKCGPETQCPKRN